MTAPTRRAITALPVLLLGCSRLPPPAVALPPGGAERIVVVRRDWHADVAFPGRDLPPRLSAAAARLPNAAWLTLGFGDRAWFAENARGPFAALSALLGGPAALHLTGLPGPPERTLPDVEQVPLTVSAAGRAAMLRFFENQMEAPLPPGDDPASLFYATRLRYAASYTCNTWTADALRAAGLPIEPDGIVFAGQLMDAVRVLA